MTTREGIKIIRTAEQKKAHNLYLVSLKQEKIKEGIKTILRSAGANEGWALNILEFLHSQRVRIEVDRELPEFWTLTDSSVGPDSAFYYGQESAQQDMLKAGYVATEPLIEDV